MDNFNQIIDKLYEDCDQTLQRGTGEAYSKLLTIFEELGSYFREFIQDKTGDEIKFVLRKLKNGYGLTDQDIDLIRLWIIDDAVRYTKLENSYQEWQNELKRLVKEISAYKGRPTDVKTSSDLRALCRDGSRVLADIFYYIQQKDRVNKFEQAIKDVGPQERSLLIGLLEQKMNMKEF
ncbi:MAG: hypothetical protein AB1650_03420 [Candidatus Omnitrophota bacterium]